MHLSILVVFAFALVTNTDGRGGDNLPADVLANVLQYTTGNAPGQVNDRWRHALQEQKEKANYTQKFNEILTPLLRTLVRSGSLTPDENRAFSSLYRELVEYQFDGLLSRVPDIIKNAIPPQMNRILKNMEEKMRRICPYLQSMGCRFDDCYWLTFYMTKHLSVQSVIRYSLDMYLIEYTYFWSIGHWQSWLKEGSGRTMIFWNTISVYEPLSGRAALDWYNKGFERTLSDRFKSFDKFGNFGFYYLRMVWCSDDRIQGVDPLDTHEFISKTRRVFSETVSYDIQNKAFGKIEKFLSELKQKNRLFLLQLPRKRRAQVVPLIPYRQVGGESYTRDEWTRIWRSLSLLLELGGAEFEQFVGRSFDWQNTTIAHIPLLKVTPAEFCAKNSTIWKINTLLRKYKFYETQPRTLLGH